MRWATDNAEALKGTEPEMPPGFDNRLGDNYRVLLAIADLAGGEWPEKRVRRRKSFPAPATPPLPAPGCWPPYEQLLTKQESTSLARLTW